MNATYALTRPELVWEWQVLAREAHVALEAAVRDIWRDWTRPTVILGQQP